MQLLLISSSLSLFDCLHAQGPLYTSVMVDLHDHCRHLLAFHCYLAFIVIIVIVFGSFDQVKLGLHCLLHQYYTSL